MPFPPLPVSVGVPFPPLPTSMLSSPGCASKLLLSSGGFLYSRDVAYPDVLIVCLACYCTSLPPPAAAIMLFELLLMKLEFIIELLFVPCINIIWKS